ncbi:MAG TPA: DUF1064 domain-containing protein [Methanosarcinales archaeon]|nr:DUF1064 domain-containing protein [Methanosarcinales archaeon]
MQKYGNKICIVDGIRFQSIKESNRYLELKLLEKAGVIKELTLQKSYILLDKCKIKGQANRAITYKADFEYVDIKEGLITEDCKGMRTEVYKIKKKLFEAKYGRLIREV